MNIGIVLAGGKGSRFGSSVPKQYQTIKDREVIFYSISALRNSKNIDKIIIVSELEYIRKIRKEYTDVIVIEGGNSRNESIYNAIQYVHQNFDCEKVIILDSARPMITATIVDDYIEKLNQYDLVITGQRIVDSLGCYMSHTANRDDYYLIQAPEAFDFKMLFESFDKDSRLTATNQQMPESSSLYINFDFVNNYKITYSQDLKYFEYQMDERP